MMMMMVLVLGTEEIGSADPCAPSPSAEGRGCTQMQLQNYQEKLLAPVPSHPRVSLSNPYRLHLIPLPVHGPAEGLISDCPLLSGGPLLCLNQSVGVADHRKRSCVSLLGACNQSDLLPVLPKLPVYITSLTS